MWINNFGWTSWACTQIQGYIPEMKNDLRLGATASIKVIDGPMLDNQDK
jgi:hypothetical protein